MIAVTRAPATDASSTQVKPQAVRTAIAAQPVTVTVAARPRPSVTHAQTATVTPPPPVTVTQQAPPIVIAPQPDQYSPAYTSVHGLPSGLLYRDLNNMGCNTFRSPISVDHGALPALCGVSSACPGQFTMINSVQVVGSGLRPDPTAADRVCDDEHNVTSNVEPLHASGSPADTGQDWTPNGPRPGGPARDRVATRRMRMTLGRRTFNARNSR